MSPLVSVSMLSFPSVLLIVALRFGSTRYTVVERLDASVPAAAAMALAQTAVA